jgi:hypothetical protein
MEYLLQSREYDTHKDLGNTSIFRYVINEDLPGRMPLDVDFLARNPSMNASDGYGTSSPDVVDTESMLKLDSTVTHTRSRVQLSTREYVSNPVNRFHRRARDDDDDDDWRNPRSWQALSGESTSRKAMVNDRTAGHAEVTPTERSFEGFTQTPFVPMMQAFVCNDVPLDQVPIGQSSKDIFHQYIESKKSSTAPPR